MIEVLPRKIEPLNNRATQAHGVTRLQIWGPDRLTLDLEQAAKPGDAVTAEFIAGVEEIFEEVGVNGQTHDLLLHRDSEVPVANLRLSLRPEVAIHDFIIKQERVHWWSLVLGRTISQTVHVDPNTRLAHITGTLNELGRPDEAPKTDTLQARKDDLHDALKTAVTARFLEERYRRKPLAVGRLV